jgi:hypothetical protein
MYGTVGEECSDCPGVYNFSSSCGRTPKAQILSPDVDTLGRGKVTKPRPGSTAVAIMSSNGSECFIVGFHRVAQFDEDKDEKPSVGNAEDNHSPGDKVEETKGGARMLLRDGGAVLIEGGPGTNISLNPVNNRMTLRSTNLGMVADGYRTSRGRHPETPKTSPETIHEEEFLHQVGPSFDRFRVRHGDLGDNKRRELSLASVTVVAGQETATIVTKETYHSDGSWVGEGKFYRWGGAGADEPIVLGNVLVDTMNAMLDLISKLTVNTAWGPSTPPLPGTQKAIADIKVDLAAGNILSNFLFSTKDSADL